MNVRKRTAYREGQDQDRSADRRDRLIAEGGESIVGEVPVRMVLSPGTRRHRTRTLRGMRRSMKR